MRLTALTVSIALCAGMAMADELELDNGTLELDLDVARGVSRIAEAEWVANDKNVFRVKAPNVPQMPLDGEKPEPWTAVDDEVFLAAESTQMLEDGIRATRWVGLAKTGSLFRTQMRMTNTGDAPRAIPWFPVWSAELDVRGGANRVAWWQALSFAPDSRDITDGEPWTLHSRLHSSDTRHSKDGVNPYWVIEGDAGRLYCSLDWCGGWEAVLRRVRGGVALDVRLPEDETQLVLQPGETIAGPVLTITATAEPGERESRANWMRQRVALAKALYGGPAPSYPFTYNHWYTTRFNVDGEFLHRQLTEMEPYDFDYFIIDAGWYEGCGQWVPDLDKFKEGEFESIMKACVDKGVPVGIWTCPQFLRADAENLPPEVDRPGQYEKFIDGHLLDLAGLPFESFLLDHVAELRRRYHADWWKYDQLLFVEQTRQGVMRNVVAFEDALRAVRAAHPDLMIENCQSGGRMINEFTVLATQSQWIRDGGDTGPDHAKRIVREALGAVEFLPPWTCNRWTNNPERDGAKDDEFTRMYCRCAMPGTWGLVADLGEIGDRQRAVIVKEVANYRRLNELKGDYLYDVLYPAMGRKTAGIVYYNASGNRAGALLCRWEGKDAFDEAVALEGLTPDAQYRIEDVDSNTVTELSGAVIAEQGLLVPFDKKRMSALVFIEAIEQ